MTHTIHLENLARHLKARSCSIELMQVTLFSKCAVPLWHTYVHLPKPRETPRRRICHFCSYHRLTSLSSQGPRALPIIVHDSAITWYSPCHVDDILSVQKCIVRLILSISTNLCWSPWESFLNDNSSILSTQIILDKTSLINNTSSLIHYVQKIPETASVGYLITSSACVLTQETACRRLLWFKDYIWHHESRNEASRRGIA